MVIILVVVGGGGGSGCGGDRTNNNLTHNAIINRTTLINMPVISFTANIS